jgi:hypothetical protein
MYKPRKWPHYANEGLEDALKLIEDSIAHSKQLQAEAEKTKNATIVITVSQILVAQVMAHSTLIQAKSGDYRRQQ